MLKQQVQMDNVLGWTYRQMHFDFEIRYFKLLCKNDNGPSGFMTKIMKVDV